MKSVRILVVDDEPLVLRSLSRLLDSTGFRVSQASSPVEAEKIIRLSKPDILLIDVFLGEETSLPLIKTLRSEKGTCRLPIICISAMADHEERARILRSGADDIVAKPFYRKELLARIEAVLRRSAYVPLPNFNGGGEIFFDMQRKDVFVNNSYLNLTVKQFLLMKFLWEDRDQFLSHKSILAAVWQDTNISIKTLETHISNLRKKLASYSIQIENRFGVGFRIRLCSDSGLSLMHGAQISHGSPFTAETEI